MEYSGKMENLLQIRALGMRDGWTACRVQKTYLIETELQSPDLLELLKDR